MMHDSRSSQKTNYIIRDGGLACVASKRFREIWEQRKTEERDFPVILCFRTAQKRLLRRLEVVR